MVPGLGYGPPSILYVRMEIAMARKLLNAEGPTEGGISCADCVNPSHPAVVAADYIGFIALGAASWILLMKLASFKGPEGDDKYFMGWVMNFLNC